MANKKKAWKAGNTTLECAILLPLVFACIFAVIVVFLALYQKSLLQNMAEDAAESLSRQWGYSNVSEEEMMTGVYKEETFREREIYWNLKVWNNNRKENKAEAIIKDRVEGLGPLKIVKSEKSTGKAQESNAGVSVTVEYKLGLVPALNVYIRVPYRVPGAGLLKLVGLGDYIIMQGLAEAHVYNTKDMINSTDYVIQILGETKTYELFMEKTSTLKDSLNNALSN